VARTPLPLTLGGHLWTVAPRFGATFRPPVPPPSTRWETVLTDPVVGRVRLTGALADPGAARRVLVLLHGLGGTIDSPYLVEGAALAHAAGLATLRLNLRGPTVQ